VGTRERKKAATRETLVDAAASLFTARGVEATTMDDIARAAGTSRTSVFNYFGHKDVILCEIGARYVREVVDKSRVLSRRSPRSKLLALADAVAEVAAREPELVAAVAREMTHPDPARRRSALEIMQYQAVVDAALDSLLAGGHLHRPARRGTYARMLVDMVAGAVIRAGGEFPRSALRSELHRSVEVFLAGVAATG
jgi:AcrR family transcriptional regulator